MPRRNLVWILGFLLVSLFAWTTVQGGLAPPHGPLQFIKGFPGQGRDYDNLALFIDVMQHIDMNYVRQLSPDERRKFIEAAIQGGLSSLDPHSSFSNPKEAQSLKKQLEGKYGGIGVQVVVNRDTGHAVIISPILGSPALKAGLRPGDEIEKINGQPLVAQTSEDVVEKISGPPGTPVTLSVRRRGSGKLIELTLQRAEIHLETLLGDQRQPNKDWDFLIDKSQKIGYIRINSYNPETVKELRAVVEHLEEEGARGLVLDLRNNPGGSLEGAVEMCDLFLEKGDIVRIEGRSDEARVYTAKPEGTLFLPAATHPMVVLVNKNSASASEIVSGCLQDHHRAVIMGERTYGKGSVQRVYPMEHGSSNLRLTTAKYLRPSGKNIHRFVDSKEQDEWGVRPDIEVKLTPQEELDWLLGRRDRDILRDQESNQLEQAEHAAALVTPIPLLPAFGTPLGVLPGLSETATALSGLPRPPRPYVDKVLDKALDYLRQKIRSEKST
jgi:carboxyl-terminal processing protease